MDRFPPIAPEEMNAAQRDVAARIADSPRGGIRGPFPALLHHPVLADRVQALGAHLRFGTGMPQKLVELAILVTARHWTAQYEWYAHEKIARREGLDPAIIAAIAEGRTPEAMPEDEAMVLAFARECLARGEPSDASFAALRDRFGLPGVLDLIAVAGYYSLVAIILNTARVPVPEGVAPPLA
jgi:4-carboxymuconolactone decarboxylase